MKACLLQAVYALAGLLEVALDRDFSIIRFLSLPEEEVPSRHHLPLLERLCQDHPSVLVFEGARSSGNGPSNGAILYPWPVDRGPEHQPCSPMWWRTMQKSPLASAFSVNRTPGVLPLNGKRCCTDNASKGSPLRSQRNGSHFLLWRQLRRAWPWHRRPGRCEYARERHTIQNIEEEGRMDARRALACPMLDGFGVVGAAVYSPHEHLCLQSISQQAGLLAGMMAFLTTRHQPFQGRPCSTD
jgi:hypothetical protein